MNLQSKLVLSLQGYDDDQIDTMFTEEVDSAEKSSSIEERKVYHHNQLIDLQLFEKILSKIGTGH